MAFIEYSLAPPGCCSALNPRGTGGTDAQRFYVETIATQYSTKANGWQAILCSPAAEHFWLKLMQCASKAGLSDAEAQKIIENFEHPPVVIDEAIVMNCTQSTNFEIGPAFREAAKLRTVGRDKEAVACYESIAQQSTETVFRKQALYELGLLYEVGIGVEQDAAKSSYYYNQWEKL